MAEANHRADTPDAEPVYVLTEAAHAQLRTAQELLRLLSLLTQSRREDPMVPLALWTNCLHHLCGQVESVLDAAQWREAA